MSEFDKLITEEVRKYISETMDSDVYSNSKLYNELTKILKDFAIILKNKIFSDMSKGDFNSFESVLAFRQKWGNL